MISVDQVIQGIIILVGLALVLGAFDLKKKLESLDKLVHIDALLDRVAKLVDRMDSMTLKHEVSDSFVRQEIAYLKDRVKALEERLDSIPKE